MEYRNLTTNEMTTSWFVLHQMDLQCLRGYKLVLLLNSNFKVVPFVITMHYKGDRSQGDLIDFVNKHRSDAPKTAVLLLTTIYRMTMKHWDLYLFSYRKG
jgi:hypothetical protein